MDAFKTAKDILKEIEQASVKAGDSLEQFRIRFLGSKNIVKDIMAEMKNIPDEKRKEFGQLVNTLKQKAVEKYNQFKEQLQSSSSQTSEAIDLTKPGDPIPLGSRHPVSIVRKKMIDIFSRIGFTIAEGPEIENEWYNFTALNGDGSAPQAGVTFDALGNLYGTTVNGGSGAQGTAYKLTPTVGPLILATGVSSLATKLRLVLA